MENKEHKIRELIWMLVVIFSIVFLVSVGVLIGLFYFFNIQIQNAKLEEYKQQPVQPGQDKG